MAATAVALTVAYLIVLLLAPALAAAGAAGYLVAVAGCATAQRHHHPTRGDQ